MPLVVWEGRVGHPFGVVTVTRLPLNIAGMDPDDDDLTGFLMRYVDACADAGVEPLPLATLAALAGVLLTSNALTQITLH